MPTYCYRRIDNGELVAITMTMAEHDRRERRDGTIRLAGGLIARRDYQAEGGPRSGRRGWPIESNAAGVHPSQVPEAVQHAMRCGVPTDFTPDGRAILRDRAHRKRYLRARGLYDRNAGYSDPEPVNMRKD